ncbi:MAG TPA: SPOR domain-containing protein [Hyphomicrobiaceae bacterium]|nr:SPOR domain-containing protein [Hyphomicrobiaceae bacterium]
MARSNGSFGLPWRQRPSEDPYDADPYAAPGQPAPFGGHQPAAPWPQHQQQGHPQQGYGQQPAPQTVPGYHFPAPEPQPAYGYSNPQLLSPQQWPQHGEPQAYEVNYQGYAGSDPAFQHGAQQGYGDPDAEFSDEYYEDDEPRQGRRWLLIAVALVAAIGVGGALAYTYRSLVAPKSRLAAVRSEPGVKVNPGPGAEQRPPVRIAEPTPSLPPPPAEPQAQETPPSGGAENAGPRPVKTITIGAPSGAPAAPVAAPSIPGISIYRPPELPGQPPAAPAAPEATPPDEPPPAPSGRVTIGTRPSPPSPPPQEAQQEAEEDYQQPAAPPARRSAPTQVATAPIKPAPVAKPREEASSGLGYVAVLKSTKSQMDAMKAFADLQQKYPNVLGEKSFDVQSADLSARGLGTMYRVLVGPPGSHTFAANVCSQLKSAGYVGCWVKPY